MDSVFEDEASSDFEPVKARQTPKCPSTKNSCQQKTKPATKKAAAPKPKPAAKKTASTASKTGKPAKAATSKKPAKPNSDDENMDLDRDSFNDDSLLSNTPPSSKKLKKPPAPKKSSGKPLESIENESFGMDGIQEPQAKKGSAASKQKYQMLSQVEHILKRPDTYIGSVERTEQEMWVYNSETEMMENRKVNYVPGLYKIFDEILVNAADNKQNDPNMDEIRVTVDRESGEISVWNNGKGIPIEIHSVSITLSFVARVSNGVIGARHVHPRDDFRSPFDLVQLRRRSAEGHWWSQRSRCKTLQRL